MNKFRKLGFIGCNRQLEAHPSLLNVVLHDKPRNQNKVVVNIDQSRSTIPRYNFPWRGELATGILMPKGLLYDTG